MQKVYSDSLMIQLRVSRKKEVTIPPDSLPDLWSLETLKTVAATAVQPSGDPGDWRRRESLNETYIYPFLVRTAHQVPSPSGNNSRLAMKLDDKHRQMRS